MLIDVASNAVVLGGSPLPYSATVDDIDAYLAD
jgi:hypothetical protein